MLKVGKRVKIKEHSEVVEELWGRTGIISKSKTINNQEARDFFGRTKEQCPDEEYFWMMFDETIKEGSFNLIGWTGMWIKNKDHVEILD